MNAIKELWHGNIQPQEDSRTNTKEMKELIAKEVAEALKKQNGGS